MYFEHPKARILRRKLRDVLEDVFEKGFAVALADSDDPNPHRNLAVGNAINEIIRRLEAK